ncbi:MAG: hypothetical protein IJQ28_05850, partial [Clostridia bacterium]|nr:hypothetical protein [Clostridia bacterium]
MKRIIRLLILLAVTFSLPLLAFAVGEGNVDSGGGGMGSGTSTNKWIPGEEGVRVTVIRCADGAVVSHSFDLTNINITGTVYNFGIYSKIAYRDGLALTAQVGGYTIVRPTLSMPKIISSGSGAASITAIKKYFCSEYVVKLVANQTGFEYETLIDGNYKILIEPVAYFLFNGNYFAMSATQAALYDQILSGGLRAKMVSLSHKNLPLAMFLEHPDLGYAAWNGVTSKAVSNDTIINYLGLGIVRFTEEEIYTGGGGFSEITGSPVIEYDYRTDTDVITAIRVTADREYNPDNSLTARFIIGANNYIVKNIVIPEDESQLVWVKWHTPPDAQNITITAVIGGKSYYILAKVAELADNEPPDPKANDRNDTFTVPNIPTESSSQTLSWGVWSAAWHAYWVWESDWEWTGTHWVDNGQWVDNGWYDFTYNSYSASLNASQTITLDSKVPKATGTHMKSGYGFGTSVVSQIETNAPMTAYTQAQSSVMYFPEFDYLTYFRVLDKNVENYKSTFRFKENRFSSYCSRVHFTPVWYPDGV